MTPEQMQAIRTWHYKKYRVFVDDETILRDWEEFILTPSP